MLRTCALTRGVPAVRLALSRVPLERGKPVCGKAIQTPLSRNAGEGELDALADSEGEGTVGRNFNA